VFILELNGGRIHSMKPETARIEAQSPAATELRWPRDRCRGRSDTARRQFDLATVGEGGAIAVAKIHSALTKLATAGLLSLCSIVSSLAGSVTQPGSTIGPAQGTPIPPGVYFSNWTDYGCRTSPSRLCLGDTIPVVHRDQIESGLHRRFVDRGSDPSRTVAFARTPIEKSEWPNGSIEYFSGGGSS
jgi:hypothetical protein